MLAAARLVEVLPDARSKQFAALQACDEARHVEIFDRLLKTKIKQLYTIDDGLQSLIQQGLSDSRWDMVVLTTQILIEGLALAALQQLRDFSKHKLVADIGNYVLADEARHVAFGVQMLQTVYTDMTDNELTERREFAQAGLDALTQRLNPSEVWGTDNGVEATPALPLLKRRLTRQVNDITEKLFSRVSPVTKEVRYA
jgi:ribonucleotide reductase beta subunit family protein with ferritin-like domain